MDPLHRAIAIQKDMWLLTGSVVFLQVGRKYRSKEVVLWEDGYVVKPYGPSY